ncbi:MAG: hypothetical protein ChlgKO_00660 [Chlamydiales bacterium]
MPLIRVAIFKGRLPEQTIDLGLRAAKNRSFLCSNLNLLGATIFATMGVFENVIGAGKSTVYAFFSPYDAFFEDHSYCSMAAHPLHVGYRVVDGITDRLRDAALCAITATAYSFTILTSPLGIRNWVHANILCTENGLS